MLNNDPLFQSTLHATDPAQDLDRLEALDALGILDTPPEQEFEDAVRLATRLCATPIALVSLVAGDRQWFKARLGFPSCETDLDRSVCRFALAEPGLLVIPDLRADPRTAANPLVTGPPFIRFYAGSQLRLSGGQVVGTLSVMDTNPRPGGLTAEQGDDLAALGRQVTVLLELRRAGTGQRSAQAEVTADSARLEAMISTQQALTALDGHLVPAFDAVAAGALRAVHSATGVVIELLDGDELAYHTSVGSAAGTRGTRLPVAGTLSGLALGGRMPLHCPDTQADPRVNAALARELGIASMVVAPIHRYGVALGVLKVLSDKPNAFSSRDIVVAQLMAGLAGSGFGEAKETQAREALRDAEHRYKAIFDSAIDFAIVAAGPDGRITDWNAGAERMMGWPADEVRGRPLDVFFTPEDRAGGVPQHEKHVADASGTAVDERWHLRRSGKRFWAVGRMMALRHDGGDVRGFLKIMQDRTHERRREQRMSLIASASEALLSGDDPASAVLPLLVQATTELGFDQCWTMDAPLAGGPLTLLHAVGLDDAARAALRGAPADVPLCGRVLETDDPVILSGLGAQDGTDRLPGQMATIRAYAGYPVRAAGGIVGVISFATTLEPEFDAEALRFFATVAQFLSIAWQRRAAAQALVASDERSRRAQEAGRIGAFELEVATGLTAVSPEMCRIFGLPEATLYPADTLTALVIPEDAGLSSSDANRRAGTTVTDVEYRIRRADDGALRWIARRASFEEDGTGTPVRLFGTVQDVTERRRLQEHQVALLDLGDRLRGVSTAAEATALAAEALGRTLDLSRAGFAHVGAGTGRFVVEQEWTAPGISSLVGDQDLAPFRATLDHLGRGGILAVPDLSDFPPLLADAAAYDAIGTRAQIKVPLLKGDAVSGMLYAHQAEARAWTADEVAFARGVADRTFAALAKVAAEAGQRLLNEELSHRLKNTLAMVLSLASLSLRPVTERAPVEAFEQRVRALATAHDVLLQGSHAGAPLRSVIERALHGTGQPERFDLDGPAVALGAQAALSTALLLHELATNAAKYGALSNATGRVALAWRVGTGAASAAADGAPELVLRWTERGGPSVIPPGRPGFGSRIIRMGLTGTGGVTLDYDPAGLDATIRAPVARLQGH